MADLKQVVAPESMYCSQCGYRAMPEMAGPPFNQVATVGKVVCSDSQGGIRCPKCNQTMTASNSVLKV